MPLLRIKNDNHSFDWVFDSKIDPSIQQRSPEERVKLLIIRDLVRVGWEIKFKKESVLISPPQSYDKQVIRDSMQIKRQESIQKNHSWIRNHIDLARSNLADGRSVWDSRISPIIEVVETQKQLDIFRIFRFYWSSPYSEYVGRRLKLLVRDDSIDSKPLIGIAAIGSSIIHIPDRDSWIGWDTKTRTQNLIYAMDAYVLGALPPYNYLLGGKLISYLIASNEIRAIFKERYKDKVTNISKRKANDLACVFTTSLYGRSSQYNRVRYNNNLLYIPIGKTKGYGTLHLTDETFNAMRELLKLHGIMVTNRFGDGPIWRMRLIRTAAELLGFDADFLLRHSFQREIYAIPLASNFKEFLNNRDQALDYLDYPLDSLASYWRSRWLDKRKSQREIEKQVVSFRKDEFSIL